MTDADTTQEGGAPVSGVRKLLVVISPDDADTGLIQHAIDLAERWKAEVSALVAVDLPGEISRIARATGVTVAEIEKRLVDEQKETAAAILETAAPGQALAVDVRLGKPFIEIIRHVVQHDIDLVIKTAEQLPGVGRYLFASTDQHLLRKCPAPVWLRVVDGASGIRSVVAAVDVDDALAGEPETLAGLNRRIVETAARIASAYGADLHLLNVWDAPGEGLVRLWSSGPDPDSSVRTYVEDVRRTHDTALRRLAKTALEAAGGREHLSIHRRMERGTPRTVIPAQVEGLKADLLVMGTIARTGIPGFIIGNTAEDVLNAVDCSVVTIKPPHYVSPVPVDRLP